MMSTQPPEPRDVLRPPLETTPSKRGEISAVVDMTVISGDFNNSVFWDKPSKGAKFGDFMDSRAPTTHTMDVAVAQNRIQPSGG
jgi:hypothetical protein